MARGHRPWQLPQAPFFAHPTEKRILRPRPDDDAQLRGTLRLLFFDPLLGKML